MQEGIGEMHDVIAKEQIVLEDVPNNASKKCDVAAGAELAPRCQPARWCAKILDRHV